jgi:hypothetical protein
MDSLVYYDIIRFDNELKIFFYHFFLKIAFVAKKESKKGGFFSIKEKKLNSY